MYRFTKIKRSGVRRTELAFPENLLRAKTEDMNKPQLRSLLVRLLLAEKRSRRLQDKELRQYHARLKVKPLNVAGLFVAKGGPVSSVVHRQHLPTSLFWPGIVGLVETKSYEECLLK